MRLRASERALTRALRRRLGDVREAVAKLLGATVHVFVTKCVQAELRSLGPEYAGALRARVASALRRRSR